MATLTSSSIPTITVYGEIIHDINLSKNELNSDHIAEIHAFKLLGKCTRLPSPLWLPVIGNGQDIQEGECGFDAGGNIRKWEISANEQAIVLIPDSGDIIDLLLDITNVEASPDIAIENIHIEGNSLCADIVISIEFKVLGKKYKISDRVKVCVGLGGGCITKKLKKWAKLEICYNLPNEICAELRVKIGGFRKSWKACAGVYITNICAPNPACPPYPCPPPTCPPPRNRECPSEQLPAPPSDCGCHG
jgi:hypothetical protein